MNQSDKHRVSAPEEGAEQPLPLFRPEALASQQQKLYGEILLIRPLSLAFLGWLGIAMAGSVLGFLLLGQITEKARVPGVILPAAGATGAPTQADLFVPDRILRFVQPGERLWIVGPPGQRQSVTVQQISDSAINPTQLPLSGEPAAHISTHRVVVNLSSPIPGISSASVEAEIPIGKTPLIKWLFGRPGE